MQRYHMKASFPVIDRVADSEGLYVLASEAFEALTASEARVAEMSALMLTMSDAWAHYRKCFEEVGAGDPMTGRAWMLCTRAENKARTLVSALGDVTATKG